MSLIVTAFVPSCIVMGGDSRLTLKYPDPFTGNFISQIANDTTQKVFNIQNKFGLSTHGAASINGIQLPFHIYQFVTQNINNATEIEDLPELLLRHFSDNLGRPNTFFHLAGYKLINETPTQYVYRLDINNRLTIRLNLANDANAIYNAECGGEIEVLITLRELNPVNFNVSNQQQAVGFIDWVINTASTRLNANGYSSVGGPTDILMISPNGSQWLRRKPLNINVL